MSSSSPRKLLVPGPGRDAAITEAKTRTSTARSGETAQVSGFLIKSYSPAEADVDLAIKTPERCAGAFSPFASLGSR